MSKRNFILLIIVLVIIILIVFGFLFFQKDSSAPGESGGGTNFLSQFNPFGSGTTNPPVSTPPADVSGYVPPEEIKELQLIKVSSMPIAGFTVYQKERLKEEVVPPLPTETNTETPPTEPIKTTPPVKPTPPATEFVPALRYADKASGNIYQTFADKIDERKFSTTTIPKVYEALFGNKGESVVMRYLKSDGRTIETFVGNLPKEILGGDTTENNEVRGTFLPENVQNLSLSADASSLLYLFTTKENIIGTTLNFTTNKKEQIFDSPFTEWLSWWPNNKMITVTTKPASSVPGYMYAVDPTSSNKSLVQVLGGINGLTTLTSPDGKLVLYSSNSLSLNIYNTATKSSTLVGVRTMPEKCVWGKDNNTIYCSVPKSISSDAYPDSWYQGIVSFNDQIWKIDVASGGTTLVADLGALSKEGEIDGIKLALDDGEKYLLFVNKKDSFLWELRLQ